jgi:hypothetical protein
MLRKERKINLKYLVTELTNRNGGCDVIRSIYFEIMYHYYVKKVFYFVSFLKH